MRLLKRAAINPVSKEGFRENKYGSNPVDDWDDNESEQDYIVKLQNKQKLYRPTATFRLESSCLT